MRQRGHSPTTCENRTFCHNGYHISAWRLIASLQGPAVYYVSPSALFHTAHPDSRLGIPVAPNRTRRHRRRTSVTLPACVPESESVRADGCSLHETADHKNGVFHIRKTHIREDPCKESRLLPLRFSPVPSIFLRCDPVATSSRFFQVARPTFPAHLSPNSRRIRPHKCVITLASNENQPVASRRVRTCPADTCSRTTRDSFDRTTDIPIEGKYHGPRQDPDDHHLTVCPVSVVPAVRRGRSQ